MDVNTYNVFHSKISAAYWVCNSVFLFSSTLIFLSTSQTRSLFIGPLLFRSLQAEVTG